MYIALSGRYFIFLVHVKNNLLANSKDTKYLLQKHFKIKDQD